MNFSPECRFHFLHVGPFAPVGFEMQINDSTSASTSTSTPLPSHGVEAPFRAFTRVCVEFEWVRSSIFHAFIWHFILVTYLISLQVLPGVISTIWMEMNSVEWKVYFRNLWCIQFKWIIMGKFWVGFLWDYLFVSSGNFSPNCCNQRFNEFLRASLFVSAQISK